MRPIRPLPFGLRPKPASAALAGLAMEQPLPAPSALHPSGLGRNAIRRLNENRPYSCTDSTGTTTAKKASTSAMSRVRRIGGSERQIDLP